MATPGESLMAPDTAARQWVLDLVNYEMDRTDENNDEPTAGDYLVDVVRFLARQLPHGDPAHQQNDCMLDDEHHGFPEGMPRATTRTCRHCERGIVNEGGRWIDPEATGDDSVWRETCDSHDTFVADHEPI